MSPGGAVHTITRLSAGEFAGGLDDLAGLLAEAVADGSSLGFLRPFGPREAAAWWRGLSPAVADGSLAVWAARDRDGLAGTVGLALEAKPNGRHRAEVVKLMVRADARGRGLGRELLATAERAAAEAGITLLLLDTVTGTPADHLYRAAGWTRYGVVPGYAADPAGTPEAVTFYYKTF